MNFTFVLVFIRQYFVILETYHFFRNLVSRQPFHYFLENIIEVKKGCSVQVQVVPATTGELLCYGIVHNNPEMFQNTIIGMDAPGINEGTNEGTIEGTIEEWAAFDAGPKDQIKWGCFNVPNYGQVLGFTAPAETAPWIKFNTLSTHRRSKF